MAKLDILYVKKKKGILKIVELILTCVAFSCMVVAGDGLSYIGEKYNSRYDFFLAAHILAFVFSAVIFLVHLISMQDTLGSTKIWNILNLVFCAGLAALCAIAAGLMIYYAENEHQSVFYKMGATKWRRYTNNRITAIAFGFFSSVVLLVDGFFQFLELR